jgi:hypothetical protein
LFVVGTVAILVAAGFTVTYVTRTVHQLCGIIQLQAAENPPPTTERGKALLREAKKLSHQFHCD